MKKVLFRLMSVFCLCGFLVSATLITQYVYRFFTQKKINNNVVEIYQAAVPEQAAPPEVVTTTMPPTVSEAVIEEIPLTVEALEITEHEKLMMAETIGRKRFSKLLAINEDFIGMVMIDGLEIKLPFVQGPDNDKYLNTNFDGEISEYGTVFLSYRNDRLLTDKNIVLFGHHMRNGSMFTPLVQYRDINTVLKAPVIVLDGLVGRSTWLVFAAYVTETEFDYINTQVDGDAFDDLLKEINERSLFHTNVEVCGDDQILTLSTCTYEFQNARFAVHARRLREGETIPAVIAEQSTQP